MYKELYFNSKRYQTLHHFLLFTAEMWSLCFQRQVKENFTVSIWGVKIDSDLSPMFKFTSEWYWFYYYLRMNLFQLTICCIYTFFIWIWRVVFFYAKIAVSPGSAIFFRQRSKVFCSWAPATTSWFETLTGSIRLWHNWSLDFHFII